MSTGLERFYRRLEAWGYPQTGTDWLRRHRLGVIVALAILSWILAIVLLMGLYRVFVQAYDVASGAFAALI
jgi:hypothetical protein